MEVLLRHSQLHCCCCCCCCCCCNCEGMSLAVVDMAAYLAFLSCGYEAFLGWTGYGVLIRVEGRLDDQNHCPEDFVECHLHSGSVEHWLAEILPALVQWENLR